MRAPCGALEWALEYFQRISIRIKPPFIHPIGRYFERPVKVEGLFFETELTLCQVSQIHSKNHLFFSSLGLVSLFRRPCGLPVFL
jgi:hypothetical protein